MNAAKGAGNPADAPLVTIGIPTYGRAEQLQRTLKSVTEQTYRNLEIYVADDASPDGTQEAVAAARKADKRIIYHRHPTNIGAVANHEYVLAAARGTYFMWLSDDDLLEPLFVERLVAELERDETVVLAFCDYKFIDEEYRTIGSWSLAHVYHTTPWYEGQLDFWSYPYTRSANLVHGIHRTRVLRRVRKPFHNTRKRLIVGHEAPLLAQVAGHGRIVAVPECLFSRMSHHRDRKSLNHVASASLTKIDVAQVYAAIFSRLAWYAIVARVPPRQRLRLVSAVVKSATRKGLSQLMTKRTSVQAIVADDLRLMNRGP